MNIQNSNRSVNNRIFQNFNIHQKKKNQLGNEKYYSYKIIL